MNQSLSRTLSNKKYSLLRVEGQFWFGPSGFILAQRLQQPFYLFIQQNPFFHPIISDLRIVFWISEQQTSKRLIIWCSINSWDISFSSVLYVGKFKWNTCARSKEFGIRPSPFPSGIYLWNMRALCNARSIFPSRSIFGISSTVLSLEAFVICFVFILRSASVTAPV